MSLSNINKIILVGNLGNTPTLKRTAKGNSVLNLSIATSRKSRDSDGNEKDETHWHKATLWGKRAENTAPYLRTGLRVYVEGELHLKSWTNKEGEARKSPEIWVEDFRILDKYDRLPSEPVSRKEETPTLSH